MGIVKYVDRRNTSSVKWDGMLLDFGEENLLPLWVADMDFEVPTEVITALSQYVQQGVFGYYKVIDSYYQSYIKWNSQMHNCKIEQDWLRFSPGVVSAIYWIINFMTEEGDAVIINTPVYHPFISAINDNNRTLVDSPLINEEGVYSIDFEDFEAKVIEQQVKLFILCSPHNPIGRVWSREELDRVLIICKRHNVYVIADEVHQDLTFKKFIPVLSDSKYNDIVFSLTAPSKTFNIAALQNSIITIPDEKLRNKWDRFVIKIQVRAGNSLGYISHSSLFVWGRLVERG